ncbi:MAG: PIN domain-containing protein [Verrucomicrobiales bacterium]
MNAFLLDTITISEFRKMSRVHPAVDAWQNRHVGDEMWISVVTPLEIRQCVHLVRRKDPEFAKKLVGWLGNSVLPAFQHRMLGIDISIALQAAEYRALLNLSPNDSLIASTAEVHGFILARRKTADFAKCAIALDNPWEQIEDTHSSNLRVSDSPDSRNGKLGHPLKLEILGHPPLRVARIFPARPDPFLRGISRTDPGEGNRA